MPNRAKQRLNTNDVLVSKTRPNLNAVAIIPENLAGSIGSTGFQVLRTQCINPYWLFYFVQTATFINSISDLVQGALYPAVRPRDILNFKIPIPPLAEQQRIVEELETQFSRLDEAVKSIMRMEKNLRRMRIAILKWASEGKLVLTEADLALQEKREYESANELLSRILRERYVRWEGRAERTGGDSG